MLNRNGFFCEYIMLRAGCMVAVRRERLDVGIRNRTVNTTVPSGNPAFRLSKGKGTTDKDRVIPPHSSEPEKQLKNDRCRVLLLRLLPALHRPRIPFPQLLQVRALLQIQPRILQLLLQLPSLLQQRRLRRQPAPRAP